MRALTDADKIKAVFMAVKDGQTARQLLELASFAVELRFGKPVADKPKRGRPRKVGEQAASAPVGS